MDRLLLALAAFVSLVPPSFAQTRIPAEAEPRPSPPPAARPPATTPPGPVESPAMKAVPRGAVLEEVSGAVRAIDLKGHRLTVGAAGGDVTISFDRNTMVYTPEGLGTVLDIAPGAQIRAGRNADFLAYWVQVRGVSSATPPQAPADGSKAPGSPEPPPGEVAGTRGASAPSGPGPAGGALTPTGPR